MMQWNDVAGTVSKDAPIVGVLLGGLAGAAVGSLTAAALGTEATPDAVSAALLANPQAAALKLEELETNSRVQLQQLALTAEQNRLQAAAAAQHAARLAAVRHSVRKRAAAPPTDWVRPTITMLLLAGAAGIIYCVFSGLAEGLLRDATASLTIGTVIGYWFNELKQTLAFWFGTTGEAQRSSAEVLNFAVSPGSVTVPGEETTDKPGS
jgi:hypothetical protein